MTLGTRVKQAVLRKATITEGDVRSLLDDFNLELVEADVASSVADEICERIRDNLVGREIERKNDIHGITDGAIRSALAEVLRQDNIDLPSIMRAKKPFIIMFVGPNGHGKTTTISKVAHMLKKNGLHVVLAAADTFRAASIEQLETLSSRVGVEVVRHKYGSDPAAVCFDAVKHAEARGLDAVLIDTAGRSELNINLMEQLKKIVRVAKPDMKVYVGEALAGNAAVEEARRFHEAIGLDGIIMSKADCDVKGGSILSIAHVIRKPILFIGTGQGIDDLMPFSHEWFIKKVLEE
ncbi:signal recognition particle-docking protein FtsY [Candidatus Micrarchaeota archaeon]|nr:signal recognition particle-docking protein FtsY [Candidatus Micrarchaeota archaeon]